MGTPTGFHDDPFGGSGRTFAIPTPGQRAGPRAGLGGVGPTQTVDDSLEPPPPVGLNRLVAVAQPLLGLLSVIRNAPHVGDPAALKQQLAHAIRRFESEAQAAGVDHDTLVAARYVLCTALDEAAAGTPWGGSGAWAHHNLLVSFHNEAYGGEKVFQLMARLAEQPAQHRELLELIYAVLALGFQGRFRMSEGGHAQLEAVRSRLAQMLREQRGPHAAALASHWRGQPAARRRLLSWLPLWVTTAVAALALGGGFLGVSIALARASDPLFARIANLHAGDAPAALPVVSAALPAPAAGPVPARLRPLLQPDVEAGLIAVRDEADRSLITLRGDGLFASGTATLDGARLALVGRIGAAVAPLGGRVQVTGHTDNQPIRSARFPSNWQLSQARAESVRQRLIEAGVPAAVVRAEGRAESEPVADNREAAGRAANRRVDITVQVPR